MTALQKYQRLETTGLWRRAPDAQRREVIVSFGDATVVLTDKNDVALAHWSLAALSRINPRERPALYSPDPEGTETLELDDEIMVRAIEKVISAVARTRPHPGRLRKFAVTASITTVAALLLLWLPGALVRHTASVVPEVTRDDIGDRLLADMGRLSGERCRSSLGDRALERLRERLTPESRALVVLRSGVAESEHLPGGIILLNRALVEDHESVEVVAGFVLAETLRATQADPLVRMLHAVGSLATFRLLTTGTIPDSTLATYAEDLLTSPAARIEDDALLARFEDSDVQATPYAYARDVSGETTLRLIEADPHRGGSARPVLGDGDWVSLQNICLD